MVQQKKTKKIAPKAAVVKTVVKKKNVTPSFEFSLHAPGAVEVFLAGDFNGWEGNSVKFRMRKYKGDIWKKKVALKSGRYEYKFVVDGSWRTDPENRERAVSSFGAENSVVNIS